MEYAIPLIIIVSIIVFFILVLFISEKANENVERLWKIVKFEFIITISINIALYIVKSLSLNTLKNFFLFIPIVLILLFIILILVWIHYKKTRLRLEQSTLFQSVSDGNGRFTQKSTFVGALSIYSILIPILTIINIYSFIFET